MTLRLHGLLRNTLLWLVLFVVVASTSIGALVIANRSDHTASNAKLAAVTTAAEVARREASAAFAKSEAADRKAAEAQRTLLETARQQFCKVIEIQASNDPPPTTARGFAAQEAYRQLAKTSFLHCEA